MPSIKPITAPVTSLTAQTQPKRIVTITPDQTPVTPEPAKTVTAAPVTTGQPDSSEGTESEASKLLSPEHSALARKEKAIRDREKDVQAKEAAIDARIKAAIDEALGGYKTRLKSSPLDVLNEEGLTYDQLVEQAVNQPDPETRNLQSKLSQLEQTVTKQQEDIQNREKAQRDSAINQIRHNVKSLVDTDESYETIKGTENYEDVVSKIVETFDTSGILMSVEEAAKQVEEELFQEAVKISSLGKVSKHMQAKLTPQLVEDQTKQPSTQQPQIKTLTNSMTNTKPMTARERALARFHGEKF